MSNLQPEDVIHTKSRTATTERAAEIRRAGECPECGSVQRAHKCGGTCNSVWHKPETLGTDAVICNVLDALRNSETTVDATASHCLVKALAVLLLTPHIRQYLEANAPLALERAVDAITKIT